MSEKIVLAVFNIFNSNGIFPFKSALQKDLDPLTIRQNPVMKSIIHYQQAFKVGYTGSRLLVAAHTRLVCSVLPLITNPEVLAFMMKR